MLKLPAQNSRARLAQLARSHRARLVLAASTFTVLFVSTCSVYGQNLEQRERDDPTPAPTVTVTAPAPAPANTPVPAQPTATVTVRVLDERAQACKKAGEIAQRVRDQTSAYTKVMSKVPPAISLAQRGIAMRNIGQVNQAEQQLNDADNASTVALQELIDLDQQLQEFNSKCAG